jgi:pimeloyl-ACP methyl ester carboxylesterase
MRSIEDVTFDSDGYAIKGTFTQADNPVAAAVLLTGSGKSDRDSNVPIPLQGTLRTDITKALAGALASVNVSTLRYDKRGVGASDGDALHIGMDDRRADARTAVNWLAAKTGATVPVLAIGHSEGAWYAAELAADGAVNGAALLSAGARPARDVLSWQQEKIAAILSPSTRTLLRMLHVDVVRSARKRVARIEASDNDVIRIQGMRMNARWMRDFLAYDPVPVLERIDVPVLAITGGHDVQVPPEDADIIGGLVKGPFEGHVVGDLSHLLRPDPEPVGPRGYRRAVRAPVSPEVLTLVTDWVTRHWGQPPAI